MTGYTDLAKLESSRNCLRRIARHDEQQFSKDSIVNVMEKFVKTVNIMDETILVPCRLMDSQVGDATDIIQAPAKTSASHFALNGAGSNNKNRKKTVHEVLNSADLFNLYNMLNSLKNDLLWTRNDDGIDETEDEGLANAPAAPIVEIDTNLEQNVNNSLDTTTNTSGMITTTTTTTTTVPTSKGHNRRPSTASMASTNSVSNLSDSESDISNENDSGIESEGNCGNSQNGGNGCGGKSANFDKATDLAKQCRQHLSGLYRCLEQMTDAANYLTARYQNDIGQA